MDEQQYDDDFMDVTDDNEPYFLKEDTGYGTCSECGSYLENWGAVSDGDGDLYDELGCPNCQEARGRANEKWIDDAGKVFDDEADYFEFGVFDDDEVQP